MIHILSKTLGFQGVTYWDKFTDTDEEWKEYLRLKALKKTSIMDKYESKNKIKELAKRQLDLGKSYKEVMGLYDIKESTLYNWFPHSNSTARLHNIDKQAPGVFPPKESFVREIRKGEQQGG